MAGMISLYPEVTDELLNKIQFNSSDYEFFYVSNDEEFPLRWDPIDGSLVMGRLVDERGIWVPDDYSIGLRCQYDCIASKNLFGVSGVACSNAVIGVALMWTSSQSRQRGTIQIGELYNQLPPQELEFEHEFEKAQLRGSVEFSTILYIKTPAEENEILDGERILANKRGYILGEIGNKFILQLDGSGSMFPIYEENRPGEPLWRVKCEWDEVLYSSFNESVKIFFNKSNPAYKFIDKSSKKYNPYMLQEVMASALTTIIMEVKSDDNSWSEIEQGKDAQPGSLAEAISYFINTLGWRTDNIQALSLSIREFLEKRM